MVSVLMMRMFLKVTKVAPRGRQPLAGACLRTGLDQARAPTCRTNTSQPKPAEQPSATTLHSPHTGGRADSGGSESRPLAQVFPLKTCNFRSCGLDLEMKWAWPLAVEPLNCNTVKPSACRVPIPRDGRDRKGRVEGAALPLGLRPTPPAGQCPSRSLRT